MSTPFKMKGWSPFTQKKEILHVKPGSTADKKSKGWKGLTVSEGQGSKRKGKYTVDPDAPGYKYGPGYEPPVTHVWDYKKRNEL
jgi:hypothetical protein